MKIDIWSDIRCPFCYIGKRKFEMALERFPGKDEVIIEWHSFELDPYLETQPGKSIYDYLAERKGASREWSERMHEQVTRSAKEVGLVYDFEKVKVASSFDAHRLIQFAKTLGLADQAEERLFHSYFTDGLNISDHDILIQLGTEIGMKKPEVEKVIHSKLFSESVHEDQALAESMGVPGVPFFVFNKRFAVSGAQSPEIFLNALSQTFDEMNKDDLPLDSVDIEGNENQN